MRHALNQPPLFHTSFVRTANTLTPLTHRCTNESIGYFRPKPGQTVRAQCVRKAQTRHLCVRRLGLSASTRRRLPTSPRLPNRLRGTGLVTSDLYLPSQSVKPAPMSQPLQPFAVCALSLLLISCAQENSHTVSPAPASTDTSSPLTFVGCTQPEITASASQVQRGIASYYHDSLAGNLTASGVRYRLDQLTAAHRKLRFGTRLRVTRTDSSTAPVVCVTVNDRGPFAGNDRIIDLSRRAAESLEMVRAGLVPVKIEILPATP